MGADSDVLRSEALKRLKGDMEDAAPRKKGKVRAGGCCRRGGGSPRLLHAARPGALPTHASKHSGAPSSPAQDKEGPKALEEYCKDLCQEVRAGKIDPVSPGGGSWQEAGVS